MGPRSLEPHQVALEVVGVDTRQARHDLLDCVDVERLSAVEAGQGTLVDVWRHRDGALRDDAERSHERLLTRMFGGLAPDPVMLDAVASLHASGVRTALLSNAFGLEYLRDGWTELFDATVISDEVGMRKPDPAIYHLACDRLGVDPSSVVYLDDFEENVAAAVALGMTGIHHLAAATTIPALRALFQRG